MDKSTFESIEESISEERLAAYKADGASNEVALARYIYNIELSKSLYPILILDFIRWMSQDMHKIAVNNDTFEAVYKEGITPFKLFIEKDF